MVCVFESRCPPFPPSHLPSLPPSLTLSLPHSLPPSLPPSHLPSSLPPSLSHSLTPSLNNSLSPSLPQADFIAWLTYHKRKWKLQRIRRQEHKQLLSRRDRTASLESGSLAPRQTSHNLTGFLRKQTRALIELPWQLIQVCMFQNTLISVCFVAAIKCMHYTSPISL